MKVQDIRGLDLITLHELVASQAAISPSAVAVSSQAGALTYAELNEQSNRLARHLRSYGVSFEHRVGILLERSLDAIVAIVAALKCGAAFVPLDPGFPRERLALMVEDSGASVVVTLEKFLPLLEHRTVELVALDAHIELITAQPSENIQLNVSPLQLAYIIYTSGSTGRPKGVMTPHRGVVNLLLWARDNFQLQTSDVFLHIHSLAFDMAVWEIFLPFAVGGRLVIGRPSVPWDVKYLSEVLGGEKVTTLSLTPSVLKIILEDPAFEASFWLKRIFVGGEALSGEVLARVYQRWGERSVELYNIYGPTEASIWVTFWRCHPQDSGGVVPVGYPLPGAEIYLVDAQMNPVPEGVEGEILIGGVAVGRGYLNLPDLTGERFLPSHSPHPGDRIYRTGDRGRRNPSGAVEYRGRIDRQVKIRGFRIELAEIEAALRSHRAVREAVVVDREDVPGGRRLLAYVVLADYGSVDPGELRSYLSDRLPAYMVPAAFVTLGNLPRTSSGKVDRHALPYPEPPQIERASSEVIPKSPMEEALAQIWREMLALDRVEVGDNFFALGGHSLLAARLVSRVRKTFHADLSLRSFIVDPTVRGLAKQLQESVSEERLSRPAAIVTAAAADRRLAEAQRSRDLLEAVMEGDWLGLRLLSLLRDSTGASVSEAARLTGQSIDEVAVRMASLLACGAVSLSGQKFVCTRYGYEVVQKIELATGINLGSTRAGKEGPWDSQMQSDGT